MHCSRRDSALVERFRQPSEPILKIANFVDKEYRLTPTSNASSPRTFCIQNMYSNARWGQRTELRSKALRERVSRIMLSTSHSTLITHPYLTRSIHSTMIPARPFRWQVVQRASRQELDTSSDLDAELRVKIRSLIDMQRWISTSIETYIRLFRSKTSSTVAI